MSAALDAVGRCNALWLCGCKRGPCLAPPRADSVRPHPRPPLRQVDDTEVINFLLSTEIIPLCLRTMETGSELSKTVATFIVQKILLDNVSWREGG